MRDALQTVLLAVPAVMLAACAAPLPGPSASGAAAVPPRPGVEDGPPVAPDSGPPQDGRDVVPPAGLAALLEAPEPAIWLVATFDGRPACQEWRLDSVRADDRLGNPDPDLGGRRPMVHARTARLVQQLAADAPRPAVQLRLSFPGSEDRAAVRIEGAQVAVGGAEPTRYAARIGACAAIRGPARRPRSSAARPPSPPFRIPRSFPVLHTCAS